MEEELGWALRNIVIEAALATWCHRRLMCRSQFYNVHFHSYPLTMVMDFIITVNMHNPN